ncbi:hypothetical protein HGRIS_006098 [Hohenbuehelia grisea]|uniref:Uncharacterized protein n=1 Tax=Hohenbuehelia grisea TaxID=104357 RepID=A0ABR3JZZ5_9AGAR
MHHCLKIEEIVRHIAASIDFSSKPILNEELRDAALSRMARTCKGFQEPALDRLWHTLPDNILPLLALFPGDSWGFRAVGGNNEEFYFRRIIHPEDWSRFNYYAPKVRVVAHSYEPGEFASVCQSALLALSLHRLSPKLLPNLTDLTWTDLRRDIIPFIHLFLHRGITALAVQSFERWEPWSEENENEDDALHALIRTLPSICPYLTKLALCGLRGYNFSLALAAPSTSPFPLLTTIDIMSPGDLATQDLEYLSALEYLEEARFECSEVRPLVLEKGVSRFPSLRKLCMCTMYLSDTCPMLDIITLLPSSVFSLKLTIKSRCAPTVIQKLCLLTSKLIAIESLAIVMDFAEPAAHLSSYQEDFMGKVDLPHISPLLTLRNLSSLIIKAPSLRLSDLFVKSLVQGLPRLEHLHLSPGHYSEPFDQPSKATLYSLLLIAKYACRMEFLALCLDTKRVPRNRESSGT